MRGVDALSLNHTRESLHADTTRHTIHSLWEVKSLFDRLKYSEMVTDSMSTFVQ